MTAIHDLSERWGLGDSEITRALHASRAVIRRWRDGVEPNADEVARAHLLNDLLADIHSLGIDEPAGWMAERIVEGYTVTRWHLYVGGCLRSALPSNAAGELSDVDMLDQFDRDWRRTYWTSMKVVPAADGGMSIVEKTYDDVIAQTAGGSR